MTATEELWKNRQIVLVNVAGVLDLRIRRTLLLHRFDVARRLWVVTASDH